MSFRIEDKLLIVPENKEAFFNYLERNNSKKLYEDRFISSIYFDNENLDMFKDSEEGTVPRKKIRLRSYGEKPHSSTENLLETKISSAEGRFKISKITKQSKKYFKYGLLDNDYGVCLPKLKVTYLRSYYRIKNFRLTLDLNIKYHSINLLQKSNLEKKDNYFAVEIKTEKVSSVNEILKNFPFQRTRFSKYARGILKFKN